MSLGRKDFESGTGTAQYTNQVLAIMVVDRAGSVERRTSPMINVSETAAEKINELLSEENKAGSGLRVFVQGGGCSGFQYGLMIEENGQGTGGQGFEFHNQKILLAPISIRYLNGAEVDFVDTITGGGFTIKNPNATSTAGCGQPFSVEQRTTARHLP